jgi:hypothetical protein
MFAGLRILGQWLKLLHDLREQRTHSLALPQASTLPPQLQPAVTQIAQQLQARPDKLPPAGDNISSSSLSSDDEGDVPRHGHSDFPTQPRDTPTSHEIDGSEMLKIPSYSMPVSKTHHQQKDAN